MCFFEVIVRIVLRISRLHYLNHLRSTHSQFFEVKLIRFLVFERAVDTKLFYAPFILC